MELIARRAIHALENGKEDEKTIAEYTDFRTEKYRAMVEYIRKEMGFTTLKFQTLEDTIEAIGMDESELCTYCWTGKE